MPASALDRLREGNARFVADAPTAARTDTARIRETAVQQKPFAAILACSDSRVPVEFVFDQGVGDLFVVRTAGNTAGDHEVASLSYAVGALGVPMVVVMGHTGCGAVQAALGTEAPPFPELGPLLSEIGKARDHTAGAKPAGPPSPELVDRVCHSHVSDVIAMLLTRSPTIASGVENGTCGVVGAMYDTRSGRVSFFDDHIGDATG